MHARRNHVGGKFTVLG